MFDHYFYEVYGMGRFSQVIIRSGRYVIDQGETDIHKVLENVNYAHRTVRRQRAVLAWEYDEKTKKDAQRLHEIEGKMGAALEKREFLLYLQPKYALHDNSIAGAEALVRWQDGGGKDLVYPDSFIPLFEKNGFIIKLDMYMLDKVCSVIKYWIEQNIVPTTVSVNFSRLHLTNHPSFLSDVCEVVDRYNIPRELIEVEFTESVSEGNQQTFVDMFEKLHKQGFTLSMDDFGTGYSSLGLLKNIPVDVVKMDKSFFSIVKDEDASRTEAIISSVITMAHFLNIRTVAEGVEEQEQVDFLRSVGCDIVQGYYYSRPLQEKKFTEIVKSSDKRSFLDMKKN